MPRLLRRVDRLPLAGVGKPDRVAAVALLAPTSARTADLGDKAHSSDEGDDVRSLVPAALVLAFTGSRRGRRRPQRQLGNVRGLPKPLWVILCLLFPVVGGIAWPVPGSRVDVGRPATSQAMPPTTGKTAGRG